MSFIGLIYLSKQNQDFTEQQIDDLVSESEHANQNNDITGFIAYKDQQFVQYIEGEENKILTLFNIIQRDPRHSVLISKTVNIEHRKFNSWNMNFISCHILAELSVESYLFSQFNELAMAPELVTRVEKIVWQGVDVIAKQHQLILNKSMV